MPGLACSGPVFNFRLRSWLLIYAVQILAKIYDEFLMRQRKEMDTTVANEDTFRRALELILEVILCCVSWGCCIVAWCRVLVCLILALCVWARGSLFASSALTG